MHFFTALTGLALIASSVAIPASSPLTARTSCSVSEGAGTCMATSSCPGFSVAGACPGSADNQCCVQKTCSTSKGSGSCKSTGKGCSDGSFVSGACPGPADTQCCVAAPASGAGGSCSTSSGSGTCAATSSGCSGGSFIPGACPGASNIQCCVKTPSGGSGGGGGGLVNNAAITMIETFEGFRANFYYDTSGHKTIGYGHNCDAKGDCASIHAPITQAQGTALFKTDLAGYEACVCALPNAGALNIQQFGALTSFAYNSGCGGVADAFKSYMTAKNFTGICSALPATYTNGGVLSSRRAKESSFCSTASSEKSGC